ncbi:amidohydrolase [Moorellaceae bacterium AZ2]
MLDYLLVNATVVTVNPRREIYEGGAVAVKGDRIAAVGPAEEVLRQFGTARQVLDLSGKAVFPGLINTHNHLFQTLIKGLGDDRALSDWLKYVTFPTAAYLEPEDTYYGALLGCLDGLHSGTTTMVDYMYPHPRPGLSDGILEAFRTLGIRAVFGRGYMNTGEKYGVPRAIMQDKDEVEKDFRRLYNQYHSDMIKIWLAPAAPWSSDRETLLRVRDLAREFQTGVAVHISETPFDRWATEDRHGVPDVDLMAELGLMGPNLLMVHCVHLTPRDIRTIRYFDARVSYNPTSNMYLCSGVAPIPRLVEAGVTVGLGTDGAGSNNSNDMLETLKLAALLQKVHHLDPTVITAEKVLELATIDAARAIGLEAEIGSLEPGKKADLFVFNPFKGAKAVPMHHPVSTLVYSSSQANVEMVMVNGRMVLSEGKVQTIDEERVLPEAHRAAVKLAERAGTGRFLAERGWRSLAF